MINFQYARANDVADAVRQIAADPTAKFIAGGTNLIDLMKEDVERPTRLIDITRLPLKTVEETPDGGLRIGALVPTPISPTTRWWRNAIPCSRAQSWRARRRSCAMQQARAGERLLRDQWHQSHARDPWRERRVHRDAPIGYVRCTRRA